MSDGWHLEQSDEGWEYHWLYRDGEPVGRVYGKATGTKPFWLWQYGPIGHTSQDTCASLEAGKELLESIKESYAAA